MFSDIAKGGIWQRIIDVKLIANDILSSNAALSIDPYEVLWKKPEVFDCRKLMTNEYFLRFDLKAKFVWISYNFRTSN